MKFMASEFFKVAKKFLGKFYTLCESLVSVLVDSDLLSWNDVCMYQIISYNTPRPP
jgi:hypothetical protein